MITGIYQITNIINCKRYIGSGQGVYGVYGRITNQIKTLKNNCNENRNLQDDFNIFGIDNFKFEVLEYCCPEDCPQRETLYLGIQFPEYNVHRQSKFKPRKLPWQVSKLTPQIVNEIRTNPDQLKQYELARKFGLTQGTVSKIKRNRIWRFTVQ